MKKDVILHFINGQKLEVNLSRPFHYQEKELKVIVAEAGAPVVFLFDELSGILFLNGTCPTDVTLSNDNLEEVVTIDNTHYLVHTESTGKSSEGFYAVPAGESTSWRYAFFISNGIKMRTQKRKVGLILSDAGVVSETKIGEVLDIQQKLRSRRIGEIIAETANLNQEAIENTLQDSITKVNIPRNARIGEFLVVAGLVTREQVDFALATQQEGKGKKIGTLLIELGFITEEQLLQALAAKFRLRIIDLEQVTPSRDTLNIISKDMVNKLQILPIESNSKKIVIATSSPTDMNIIDNIRFVTNRNVELVVAPAAQIAEAIDKYYNVKEASPVDTLIGEMGNIDATVEEDERSEESLIVEPDSKMITFVNHVLIDAYKKGASDIHFEPGMGKEPFTIRYRVDGECYVAHRIDSTHKSGIISRLKIISDLDIAERRRPQSGKIMLRYEGRKIEYRLEVTPTVGKQEDAVLRILSASKPLSLDAMGFSSSNLAKFQEIIAKPYGIVLCVGPTGSGKTTSLHSALGHINTPSRKIWTAEDPVEITQRGLRQVQIHTKIGFNFADALRSFLRSDPDVIMIGEMRDAETAKIAIEASLTGHLVFSTLHTNSAPETVVRLIEMGMDPYNFSDALLGILAQRLALKLCEYCKKPYHPDREEFDELVHGYGKEWFATHSLTDYLPELSFMKKEGCEKCGGTGYKGRIAFHELLIGTKTFKDAIKKNIDVEQLRSLAIEEGMRTLRMDGIMKVFRGITDYEQVNKVCL